MLQKGDHGMASADNILFLMKHIEGGIKKDVDTQLRENDLTFSQSHVMFEIYKNNGSISQKKLQENLQVSHPTIVGLVQRLEKNGFISSRKDENDQRNKIIFLTKKAEDFHKQMSAHRREYHKRMMKGFTEEEILELDRLLNKLNDNISEE